MSFIDLNHSMFVGRNLIGRLKLGKAKDVYL